MPKVYEIGLLNTHYHLSLGIKVTEFDEPAYTITPSFIHDLIHSDAPPHIIDNKYCYRVERTPTTSASASFSYVLMDEVGKKMLDDIRSGIHVIPLHWNTPFVVTHPIMVSPDFQELTIFSTRFGEVLAIPGEDHGDLLGYAIENGCFVMASGLIVGLSLVANGDCDENTFIQSMDQLINLLGHSIDGWPTLYFSIEDTWNLYLLLSGGNSLIDRNFWYAFKYCSPRIYIYLYPYTEKMRIACFSIMGSPHRYISSPYLEATTPAQLRFLVSRPGTMDDYLDLTAPVILTDSLYSITYPSLSLNFYQRIRTIATNKRTAKAFQRNAEVYISLQSFLSLNPRQGLIRSLQAISILYQETPTIRKNLRYIWRKLIARNSTLWCHSLYLYFINVLTVFYTIEVPSTILPLPPIKLVRDSIFMTKDSHALYPGSRTFFEYWKKKESFLTVKDTSERSRIKVPFEVSGTGKYVTIHASWKDIFHCCDSMGTSHYKKILEKRITKRLLLLNQLGDKVIIPALMKEYYRDERKEELWR